jgi:hypothetical protein
MNNMRLHLKSIGHLSWIAKLQPPPQLPYQEVFLQLAKKDDPWQESF